VISKRSRRETLPVNAEINLTNLIDIAFVLLIIFMITAPILQGGVELELPKGEATPVESSDAIVVSLTTDGRIFIDKAPVGLEELGVQLKRIAGADKPISVRADTNVPYGAVLRALAVMNKAGVTNFGLMMEQEQDAR
jgi:biopolymer transport protein TolR